MLKLHLEEFPVHFLTDTWCIFFFSTISWQHYFCLQNEFSSIPIMQKEIFYMMFLEGNKPLHLAHKYPPSPMLYKWQTERTSKTYGSLRTHQMHPRVEKPKLFAGRIFMQPEKYTLSRRELTEFSHPSHHSPVVKDSPCFRKWSLNSLWEK